MDYPNIAFLILHQLLSDGCNWLISCPWTVFADWISPFIKVEWCIQWIASIPRCYEKKTARLCPIIGLYFSPFSYTSWTDGLNYWEVINTEDNLNEKKNITSVCSFSSSMFWLNLALHTDPRFGSLFIYAWVEDRNHHFYFLVKLSPSFCFFV